jgi:predicted solute-binding protein
MAITSNRTVASVALFSRLPIERVQSIAADTSSRTSNALLRILCAERFGIAPEFSPRRRRWTWPRPRPIASRRNRRPAPCRA